MRQKDDAKFAQCLNNLARACLTTDQYNMLKSREITWNNLQVPEHAINLFRTNNEVIIRKTLYILIYCNL